MVTPHKYVALNIIAMREALGLGQKELAERAEIDAVNLNKIEKFRKNAGPNVLAALAKFFKCDVEDLQQKPPTQIEGQMRAFIAALLAENEELRKQLGSRYETPPLTPSVLHERPKPKK